MQEINLRSWFQSWLVPNGGANLNALSQSITNLLTLVKDVKKHLNKTWDNFISYLNHIHSAFELIQYFSGESGHISCPVGNALNSDCHKCTSRSTALKKNVIF